MIDHLRWLSQSSSINLDKPNETMLKWEKNVVEWLENIILPCIGPGEI